MGGRNSLRARTAERSGRGAAAANDPRFVEAIAEAATALSCDNSVQRNPVSRIRHLCILQKARVLPSNHKTLALNEYQGKIFCGLLPETPRQKTIRLSTGPARTHLEHSTFRGAPSGHKYAGFPPNFDGKKNRVRKRGSATFDSLP